MVNESKKNTMLITAQLKRRGKVVSDKIKTKHDGVTYEVSDEHKGFVGSTLAVVAGPHKDYDRADVYTVELMNPPRDAHLPFFNSEGGWEYITISIE